MWSLCAVLLLSPVLAGTATAHQASTPVPVVKASPNAVVVEAGSVAAFAVRVVHASSKLPSNIQWTIRGLPQGVEGHPTLPCATPQACLVALRADPSSPESTSLITIVLRAGSTVRAIPVALHVKAH